VKIQHTFWIVLILIWSSLAQTVEACPSCYGKTDSPLAHGMNAGIFVLLGVVGVVLTGLAAFGIFLARRSASINAQDNIETNDKILNTPSAIDEAVKKHPL